MAVCWIGTIGGGTVTNSYFKSAFSKTVPVFNAGISSSGHCPEELVLPMATLDHDAGAYFTDIVVIPGVFKTGY